MRDIHSPDDQMQLIMDNIACGIFTVDLDWNITSFNNMAEKITGFTKEEALGKKCFEVLRADMCECDCALRKTYKTGNPITNKSITVVNKSNRITPITITAASLKDSHGELLGGVESFRDVSDLESLKKQINQSYTTHDILGKSKRVRKIIESLPQIAASASTVLIQGPSGSGKEIFAKTIHNLSRFRGGPFVAVNCGAIPDTLIEAELFGYVKGAFTDAKQNRAGKLKAAEGGTLFLDEIGDLPLPLQVKLLRVIQEKEYEPIGSNTSLKTNLRLILASNKDLESLVENGQFRDDLYYRINVVKISLPTLMERKDDIPLLVSHFIDQQNHLTGKQVTRVSDKVMRFLMFYPYKGNIRELQNIIEYAFIFCRGSIIEMRHLPQEILKANHSNDKETKKLSKLERTELKTIKTVLDKNRWNRQITANELDMNPSTLWRKMKKYELL
jgi:PAS domain S-box-containing protein